MHTVVLRGEQGGGCSWGRAALRQLVKGSPERGWQIPEGSLWKWSASLHQLWNDPQNTSNDAQKTSYQTIWSPRCSGDIYSSVCNTIEGPGLPLRLDLWKHKSIYFPLLQFPALMNTRCTFPPNFNWHVFDPHPGDSTWGLTTAPLVVSHTNTRRSTHRHTHTLFMRYF